MLRWWLGAVLFITIWPAHAADLSLQRVMLSSGGVGYFEYEAAVDGDATFSLDVPIDQAAQRLQVDFTATKWSDQGHGQARELFPFGAHA